ncbi:MAG: hypothetical protein K2X86_18245 [Cytophagaceae bacterium]|nr:hypothetical protein [Cytophagaceae bacterium]
MGLEKLKLKELKYAYKEYYKNYSILLTLGLIWLLSAYVGTFEAQLSILILLLGVTLFKPMLFLVSKTLGANKIHKDESLKLLSKSIIIGILFGLIVGFFPFVENINLFFPAFTVIFGIIFGAIWYAAGLRVYGFISLILIVGGIYIGYYFPDDFTRAGYYSAFIMAGFGLLSGIFGKKARITLRFLRKRIKAHMVEKPAD